MSKIIYVANLPLSTSEQQVQTLFEQYGEILSVKLISDSETGQMLGYGFVEMPDDAAIEAIKALSGKDYEGQTLQVNQARGRSNDR